MMDQLASGNYRIDQQGMDRSSHGAPYGRWAQVVYVQYEVVIRSTIRRGKDVTWKAVALSGSSHNDIHLVSTPGDVLFLYISVWDGNVELLPCDRAQHDEIVNLESIGYSLAVYIIALF